MLIGACKVRIHLPDNQSLKGKRQVIKSISARIRNKFNVSIAEVGDHDLWQMATLGVTCVATDSRHAYEILSEVVDFVEGMRFDGDLYDYQIEIISAR